MRNKKILSLFMFMLGLFLIFSSSVLAEQITVEYPVGGARPKVTRDNITTILKVTTDNKLLYCTDPRKYDPAPFLH